MLNFKTQAVLNAAAAELLLLADDLREAGDLDGALAASDAADATLVLLDLHGLRIRAGA